MGDESTKGSGLSLLDTALVGAGIVGGVLVVLWLVHAVVGMLLFAFKVVVLVVVVVVVARLVHAFSRNRD